MADQATLQQRLDEAEQAYHELATGVRVVTVSSTSGKSMTFNQSKLGELGAYIASLKRQLGISSNRPFRPYFG